jgi:predicted nucleic acid-binding Zn ribbon protein
MRAICVVCGKPFEKTHPNAVLCGQSRCFRVFIEIRPNRYEQDRARSQAKRRPVMKAACVVCGKPFEKWGKKITCSEQCSRERKREYLREYGRTRSANPEKHRAYYQANRAKIIEKARADREANPEKYRAYSARHRAKRGPVHALCVVCGKPFEKRTTQNTCSAECKRQRTSERMRAYAREYYRADRRANPEKYRERMRKYYRAHPEKYPRRQAERGPVHALCIVCGKPFEKRGKIILCSKECKRQRALEHNRLSYERMKRDNPEKLRRKYRARVQANPEKYNAKYRAYRLRNLDKCRERDAVRERRRTACRQLGVPTLIYAAMKILDTFSNQEAIHEDRPNSHTRDS